MHTKHHPRKVKNTLSKTKYIVFIVLILISVTWLTLSYLDLHQKKCTQNIILQKLTLGKKCDAQALCNHTNECSFGFDKIDNTCVYTPKNSCYGLDVTQKKDAESCSARMMVNIARYVGSQYHAAQAENCLENFPTRGAYCNKSAYGKLIGEKGVCTIY